MKLARIESSLDQHITSIGDLILEEKLEKQEQYERGLTFRLNDNLRTR